MKNIIILFSVIIILNSCQEPEKISIGFLEPENPEPVATGLWDKVQPGLHISYGSVDERYNRGSPPKINNNDSWNGVGWRGEKIHTQFL